MKPRVGRILPAIAFWILLGSFRAGAVSITPAQPGADEYDPFDTYILPAPDGRSGRATLDPLSVTKFARGGTTGLLSLLRDGFADWTFTPAAADLAGEFHIKTYDAIGKGSCAADEPCVGALFRLHYIPAGNDPKPAEKELHWIQRVINNHAVKATRSEDGTRSRDDKGHGTPDDALDIFTGPGGQTSPLKPDGQPNPAYNPFYDTFFTAGGQLDEDDFVDRSGRRDPENQHSWRAELYLVELTAPKKVTIYDGVSWGWQNRLPEPSTPLLLLLGFAGLAGCAWAREKNLRS